MSRVAFIDSFHIREKDMRVCSATGVPVGPMFDFYSESKAVPVEVSRNPMPIELRQRLLHQPNDTKAVALDILARWRAHIQSVITHISEKKRIGSSKYWDREIFID